MGIFLKVLGVLFLLVLLAIAYVIYRVRKFFKDLSKQFAGMSGLGAMPSRITLLEPYDEEWKEVAELQQVRQEMKELGFEEVGMFRVEEMGDVEVMGFISTEEQMYGAAYWDGSQVWVDVCSESTAGESVTASNAPTGEEIDTRPNKRLFFDSGRNTKELYEQLKEERGTGPFKAVSKEDFKAAFEEAYAKDMDWRNSRGGAPSWDEFKRTVEKSQEELTKEQLEEAYHNLVYTAGVLRLSCECVERFHKETTMSVQEWEEVRDLCFALHEQVPNSHLKEFVRDHFGGLSDSELQRLEKTININRSAIENFREFNQTLPQEMQAAEVGQVQQPVPALIFSAPDYPEPAG